MLARVDQTDKRHGAAASFIDAADVQTHVAQWGGGDDALLIHGASSDMGVFEPTVIPLLKDRCRVTAYDRPGMGLTAQRPPDAEKLETQARVAAGVIEGMGLESPVVIGHSWGGAIALRLALDRPDLVGGLLLIAPVAYEWPGGVTWHLHWSSHPLIGGLFNHVIAPCFAGLAVRDGLKGAFGPSPIPDDYLSKASIRRCARPLALRANSLDMVAAKREIIAQQAHYADIAVPVAMLVGDADGVVVPTIHSVRLAQVLPNVRIDVLQGVRHLPHEAAPDRLQELLDWVRREMQPAARPAMNTGAATADQPACSAGRLAI